MRDEASEVSFLPSKIMIFTKESTTSCFVSYFDHAHGNLRIYMRNTSQIYKFSSQNYAIHDQNLTKFDASD